MSARDRKRVELPIEGVERSCIAKAGCFYSPIESSRYRLSSLQLVVNEQSDEIQRSEVFPREPAGPGSVPNRPCLLGGVAEAERSSSSLVAMVLLALVVAETICVRVDRRNDAVRFVEFERCGVPREVRTKELKAPNSRKRPQIRMHRRRLQRRSDGEGPASRTAPAMPARPFVDQALSKGPASRGPPRRPERQVARRSWASVWAGTHRRFAADLFRRDGKCFSGAVEFELTPQETEEPLDNANRCTLRRHTTQSLL